MQKRGKKKCFLNAFRKKEYGSINWKFVSEEKFLSEDKITEIQEKLGNIKNLESTQGILEKTMGSLKKPETI